MVPVSIGGTVMCVIAMVTATDADMRKVRGMRGEPPKACTADSAALAQFADRQAQIRAALPRQPHERLVYRCEPAPKS